jgi:hypothetical protein
MPDWLTQLGEVFWALWTLVLALLAFIAALLPHVLGVGLWCVWWALGVNWKKMWPALAEGGWAPLVLLMVAITLAWSRIVPGQLPWQIVVVGGLVGLALFCGWLQTYFGWSPPEIAVEPVGHADDHHGHDHHGHEAAPEAMHHETDGHH